MQLDAIRVMHCAQRNEGDASSHNIVRHVYRQRTNPDCIPFTQHPSRLLGEVSQCEDERKRCTFSTTAWIQRRDALGGRWRPMPSSLFYPSTSSQTCPNHVCLPIPFFWCTLAVMSPNRTSRIVSESRALPCFLNKNTCKVFTKASH